MAAAQTTGWTEWSEDVLPGFQQSTYALGADPDSEGDLVATLARRADSGPSARVVLAVHGFTDYFFNTELVDFFAARGYRLYGLDLHKCGRSWRQRQTPHFTTDLSRYDADLEGALALVAAENPGGRVLVYGHSTGGLVVALWLDRIRRRGETGALGLAGLVLCQVQLAQKFAHGLRYRWVHSSCGVHPWLPLLPAGLTPRMSLTASSLPAHR